MTIVQELLQKVPIKESVRRRLPVALTPCTHRGTILGVRRVRDLSDDPAQIALERGQVERELGGHVDDCADATGRGEEELLGRQSCGCAGSARHGGDRVAR